MHECVNMKRFKSLTYIIIPPHIVPERRTEKVKTSTALTRGRPRKTVADKGVCVQRLVCTCRSHAKTVISCVCVCVCVCVH